MTAIPAGLNREFAKAVRQLVSLAEQAGIKVRFTRGRSSRAIQARLYRNYLLGLSPYPAAPPGRSTHERGLAVDLVTEPREALTALGRVWREAGLTWGGDFREKDPIHFDFRPHP